jgi:hypothetical protein
MKKKMGRNERQMLQRKINQKDITIGELKSRINCLEEEKKKVEKRLEIAGAETETIEEGVGMVQIIRAEVIPYGTFTRVGNDIHLDDLESVKMELTREIAKELIDQSIVQFIIKKPGMYDGPFGAIDQEYGTIGAKLYVIPWEQMRTGGTIEIRRMV